MNPSFCINCDEVICAFSYPNRAPRYTIVDGETVIEQKTTTSNNTKIKNKKQCSHFLQIEISKNKYRCVGCEKRITRG